MEKSWKYIIILLAVIKINLFKAINTIKSNKKEIRNFFGFQGGNLYIEMDFPIF